MSRPDRIAWDSRNEATEMTAPYTSMTAARTMVLADSRARRAGTAAKDVRTRPVEYSPTIVMAPRLPAISISEIPLLLVKASRYAQPGTKLARMPSS